MKYIQSRLKISIFTLVFLLSVVLPSGALASSKDRDSCEELFYKQSELAASACINIPEDKRDAKIQKIVGDIYYWGWGSRVAKNYDLAVESYKKAAAKKNLEAAFNLGVMYEQGIGVPINFTQSFQWYMNAAKQGYREAQFNLANMYAKGAGIPPNQRKAVEWYLQAAERGEVASQFNLGNRYAKGVGVESNVVESYKWYSLAMRAGDEEAKNMLRVVKANMSQVEIMEAEKQVKNWRVVRD